MNTGWKVLALRVLVREDDEQELVDALVEFVEQDPWSVSTVIDERRELTDADQQEFSYLLADAEVRPDGPETAEGGLIGQQPY